MSHKLDPDLPKYGQKLSEFLEKHQGVRAVALNNPDVFAMLANMKKEPCTAFYLVAALIMQYDEVRGDLNAVIENQLKNATGSTSTTADEIRKIMEKNRVKRKGRPEQE